MGVSRTILTQRGHYGAQLGAADQKASGRRDRLNPLFEGRSLLPRPVKDNL